MESNYILRFEYAMHTHTLKSPNYTGTTIQTIFLLPSFHLSPHFRLKNDRIRQVNNTHFHAQIEFSKWDLIWFVAWVSHTHQLSATERNLSKMSALIGLVGCASHMPFHKHRRWNGCLDLWSGIIIPFHIVGIYQLSYNAWHFHQNQASQAQPIPNQTKAIPIEAWTNGVSVVRCVLVAVQLRFYSN